MERRKLVLSLSLVTEILIIFSSFTCVLADPPSPPEFHYILGSAVYGATGPADGATVAAININTSEELTDIVGSAGNSNQSGWYLIDLMDFQSGYREGDIIHVIIQGTGTYSDWVGINKTKVDNSSLSQIVHVALLGHPPYSPQNIYPPPGAMNIGINPILKVHVIDPDGEPMKVSFYNAQDNTLLGTVDDSLNDSIAQIVWFDLEYNMTYEWYVVANDTYLENISKTWTFSTLPYPINLPPNALFTWAPFSPTTNDTLQFIDHSSDPDGHIISWYWEFGDGKTSFLQNPSHHYSDNGMYVVNLTVMDDQEEVHTLHKTVYVANILPQANFTWIVNGLTVTFSDLSKDMDGDIRGWYWEFGDGTTSVQQNPGHRYDTPGHYHVFLIVTDDNGDTAQLSQVVSIAPEDRNLHVSITHPTEDDTLSGTITLLGTAHGNFTITRVEIRFDSGSWQEAIGTTDWSYLWDTQEVDNGDYLIYARSFDGEYYSNVASIIVEVANNHPPQVIIQNPQEDATVDDRVIIRGWASDDDGNITLQLVRIRFDGGSWRTVLGTTNWLYEWDTSEFSNGYHTLEAQAFDGTDYSEIFSVVIEVDNKDNLFGLEKVFVFGGIAFLFAFIVVLIILVIILFRDKTPAEFSPVKTAEETQKKTRKTKKG